MSDMTTQQKALAMAALADGFAILLDMVGEWCCHLPGVETGDGTMLSAGGPHAATPSGAIEAHWEEITNLPPNKYLVLHATRRNRRHVRWNGYMWADDLAHPVPKWRETEDGDD